CARRPGSAIGTTAFFSRFDVW
nr:immunoglobulin heavy chain junction region [Macaca mulatta]